MHEAACQYPCATPEGRVHILASNQFFVPRACLKLVHGPPIPKKHPGSMRPCNQDIPPLPRPPVTPVEWCSKRTPAHVLVCMTPLKQIHECSLPKACFAAGTALQSASWAWAYPCPMALPDVIGLTAKRSCPERCVAPALLFCKSNLRTRPGHQNI